jgi:uncharacterized protein with PQ loop repeat
MKKLLFSTIFIHLNATVILAQEEVIPVQESTNGLSFGSLLVAVFSISLFLIVGYLLIKIFKL